MKKIFFAISILGFSGCVNGQKLNEKDIPQAVKNKFTGLYPKVQGAKWEKEDANYEAGFKEKGKETSVLIDASGKLLETESSILPSDLPKTVLEYCSKNMPGKKIKEAAKIQNANGTITYEAEVDETDYLFDAQGNFLKKNVENEKPKKD